jgi:CheY-like chemotaxis protein
MNQKVLQRQLERLGVSCDLAENGQEALGLLALNRYDIIITDCSMPVMDGLEMTRRLRAQEAAGRPRSTIIALTANAITGSAQLCYEAGADAYLSKPLKLADLSATLTQWQSTGKFLPTGGEGATGTPTTAQAPAEDDPAAPIDRDVLAQLIGQDDPALIDQVVRDFFHGWQDSLSAIDRMLEQRDATGISVAAHAAKGTAQYGAAVRLAAACSTLEVHVKSEQWAEAAANVHYLKSETRRLHDYLTKSGVFGNEQLKRA